MHKSQEIKTQLPFNRLLLIPKTLNQTNTDTNTGTDTDTDTQLAPSFFLFIKATRKSRHANWPVMVPNCATVTAVLVTLPKNYDPLSRVTKCLDLSGFFVSNFFYMSGSLTLYFKKYNRCFWLFLRILTPASESEVILYTL